MPLLFKILRMKCIFSVHKEQVKGRGDRKTRPLAPVDLSDAKTSVFAHTGYLFLKTIKEGGAPAEFL